MARPEIENAMANALASIECGGGEPPDDIDCLNARNLLAVVEPMIRQDERQQCGVLIEKIESAPQSVRVSEVLDLIAGQSMTLTMQYETAKQVLADLESGINQLAGNQ